eukprot:6529422-Alexandrium_andersonii.AAC.1
MATSAPADPPTAGRFGTAAPSSPASPRLRLAGSGGGFGSRPRSTIGVAFGGATRWRQRPPRPP